MWVVVGSMFLSRREWRTFPWSVTRYGMFAATLSEMFLSSLANTFCAFSCVSSARLLMLKKTIKTYTHLQILVPSTKFFLWRYSIRFYFASVIVSYIALQQMLNQTISLEIFKRLSSINFTWSILEHLVPKHIKELTYP